MQGYRQRLVDTRLDTLIAGLPAIALEGAKGVGKTATALQRAADVFALDNAATYQNVAADPVVVESGSSPTFIDEWQLVPPVWDVVRRAVDHGAPPGRFLLAGSAMPSAQARTHSGAGRIVRLLMRPLSLPERDLCAPTVSLGELLDGVPPTLEGRSELAIRDYVDEILASGFPGIRTAAATVRGELLRSYVDRIVDHDVREAGLELRRPAALRSWLTAYAAATASTASYASILDAATPGHADKPSKVTSIAYRELLERIWVLEPLPAWLPTFSHLARLGKAPKHHLVDPALAATTLGISASTLLTGEANPVLAPGTTMLGALFESLVTQTVRVLADAHGARVSHMRMRGGDREIDLVVERADMRVLAIEVKLGGTVTAADTRHLNWLSGELGDRVLDRIVITTGDRAYRRPDGTGVVPLALLGA